jgi:hypothetical protein
LNLLCKQEFGFQRLGQPKTTPTPRQDFAERARSEFEKNPVNEVVVHLGGEKFVVNVAEGAQGGGLGRGPCYTIRRFTQDEPDDPRRFSKNGVYLPFLSARDALENGLNYLLTVAHNGPQNFDRSKPTWYDSKKCAYNVVVGHRVPTGFGSLTFFIRSYERSTLGNRVFVVAERPKDSRTTNVQAWYKTKPPSRGYRLSLFPDAGRPKEDLLSDLSGDRVMWLVLPPGDLVKYLIKLVQAVEKVTSVALAKQAD